MTTAQHAIKAARNFNNWGRFAATMYCLRRGVPLSCLRIARQCEATKNLK